MKDGEQTNTEVQRRLLPLFDNAASFCRLPLEVIGRLLDLLRETGEIHRVTSPSARAGPRYRGGGAQGQTSRQLRSFAPSPPVFGPLDPGVVPNADSVRARHWQIRNLKVGPPGAAQAAGHPRDPLPDHGA